MALPPEKMEPLREKFKRAKERRIAELLEKFQRKDEENTGENSPRIMEQKREKDVADRIIGSTEETLETTSPQQKIDPVITTKEVAVTTEIDQEMNLPSSTMLLTNDKSVQAFMPIKIRRSKCTNCCGGLPGCGPGLGQGCEKRCSCIPGLQIRENRFCDEEEITQNSMDKFQLPRLFVTRHRGSRLRGGGGGVLGEDSRKTKMPRIWCREEKNLSLLTQSSRRRRKRKGSTKEDKEHRLPRRFRRSLSSPRGQLARWKEARGSYWESCLHGGGDRSRSGKNCVGRWSVSAECVPTLYNSVSEVLPGISERPQNFRRKQNVMAAATVGWTSRSNKLRRRTTASPLLALSATSKCFRKSLVDLVVDKYREYLPWETLTIAFDERGWLDSSFRRHLELFLMLRRKTSKEGRNDYPDGYSLRADPDKTISSTSDVRLRSSTENRFYFPLEIMIRVQHGKSCRNYNFSQQRGYPSRRVLKLERNDQDRLRGGGSTFDLITQRKLQGETNSKDRSAMDNLDDIVITPLYKDKENNVTGVTFSENTREDECPWSYDLTNKRVQRFREDQGYCGGPEHRNEDGRIRGGCGGSYKPVQHSYFSNASTILGRRDLQYPRSPCCPPARPQVSCRSTPAGRPPSCQRSSPICSPSRFQNHVSCGRIDPCNDTEGCCQCNFCGGPACTDNSNVADINRCCRTQQKEQDPCQCKCQTCKGFRSCGGCGGQSCGRIYSCSGSAGGTCCFPRNTGKRTGPECCGGGNSNCGGCC